MNGQNQIMNKLNLGRDEAQLHYDQRNLMKPAAYAITTRLSIRLTFAILFASILAVSAFAQDRVKTANGIVERASTGFGIRVFKGIPFAASPVGDLRWQPPQPVKDWEGVRKA